MPMDKKDKIKSCIFLLPNENNLTCTAKCKDCNWKEDRDRLADRNGQKHVRYNNHNVVVVSNRQKTYFGKRKSRYTQLF